VSSGIRKQPAAAGSLHLGRTNLDGDGQADLANHGGVDKAVYAYTADHFPYWERGLAGVTSATGWSVGPAAFGENLTLAGVTEGEVCIGDRWAWGDAVLEVCQPRWPCYKLSLHSGIRRMADLFRSSGHTGWYLRVITEGTVPAAGPITVAERHPLAVSVLEAHQAALPSAEPEAAERVLAAAALAEEWRQQVIRRHQ
jgi:MOSC domain-containing protein YiiM